MKKQKSTNEIVLTRKFNVGDKVRVLAATFDYESEKVVIGKSCPLIVEKVITKIENSGTPKTSYYCRTSKHNMFWFTNANSHGMLKEELLYTQKEVSSFPTVRLTWETYVDAFLENGSAFFYVKPRKFEAVDFRDFAIAKKGKKYLFTQDKWNEYIDAITPFIR